MVSSSIQTANGTGGLADGCFSNKISQTVLETALSACGYRTICGYQAVQEKHDTSFLLVGYYVKSSFDFPFQRRLAWS